MSYSESRRLTLRVFMCIALAVAGMVVFLAVWHQEQLRLRAQPSAAAHLEYQHQATVSAEDILGEVFRVTFEHADGSTEQEFFYGRENLRTGLRRARARYTANTCPSVEVSRASLEHILLPPPDRVPLGVIEWKKPRERTLRCNGS